MFFLQKQRYVISVAELLRLNKVKDEELRLKDVEIRGLKTGKKKIEEKYKGKGRGKMLETENKELKDENRKHNNELKEVKYENIWKHVHN